MASSCWEEIEKPGLTGSDLKATYVTLIAAAKSQEVSSRKFCEAMHVPFAPV